MATQENSTQTLTAKFKSTCVVCRQVITPGSQIKYNKAQGSWHASCEQAAIPEGVETWEVDDWFSVRAKTDLGRQVQSGWQVGQVVRNPYREFYEFSVALATEEKRRRFDERKGPEFFYVLRVWKYTTPVYDDGCSGGETDYYAVVRAATEEEAAPIVEAEQRKARAAEAREQLQAVAREIQETGERPAKADHPQGEKVVLSKGHYQDNEYFVIAENFIWRVFYNGRDGDDWGYNNLSNSVGDRVPYTQELAARIRQLQEVARG